MYGMLELRTHPKIQKSLRWNMELIMKRMLTMKLCNVNLIYSRHPLLPNHRDLNPLPTHFTLGIANWVGRLRGKSV
ncbi:hypothetical protein KY289_008587 [Solanum tuberosum]|nr:hypothetical protein KY289_008587 [Solanum tuberosum]